MQKINSSDECDAITGDQVISNVVAISTNEAIKTKHNFVTAQFRTIPVYIDYSND
jgi:hypothetical protein